MTSNKDRSRIVLGMGTGRCGTDSFVKLLNFQKGMKAYHEHFFLQWEVNPVAAFVLLAKFLMDARKYDMISDVAFYWIKYVPIVLDYIPSIKCVCLWREKEDVVNSFFEHTKDRNLWTTPTSEHWDSSDYHAVDPMMLAFPKYDLPKKDAIARYWDEYNRHASVYAQIYPSNFIYAHMDDALNTESGQRRVLSFIGIPIEDQVIELNIKSNVRKTILVDIEPMEESALPIKCCSTGCEKNATEMVHVRSYGIVFHCCSGCVDRNVKRFTKLK